MYFIIIQSFLEEKLQTHMCTSGEIVVSIILVVSLMSILYINKFFFIIIVCDCIQI